jgi:hypothetical protein
MSWVGLWYLEKENAGVYALMPHVKKEESALGR